MNPARLLVVSATIGEGHNATASALEERAGRLWPDCEIRRVDTLDAMGRATGPAFRWIYRTNVESTPWLYDFFYRQLWRRPWFADASCRFTGAWAGRALAPVVAGFRPELVVSTYPLGTGGLDWLRRRGRLDVPLAAIISDFAPHPFWVYPEVDQHYVASEPSLAALRLARPDAAGVVGAPPVVTAFHPADRAVARAGLGLPASGPLVLVSCGSLGFGSVDRAVDAALAADPRLCVVVACGRNEPLRAGLAARGEPADRLVPLGWTDRMPELTSAADVVVTNAGGATALEALACGRAVLLFEPIAGHGKANAELMQRAGLGRVCPDRAGLTGALRELLGAESSGRSSAPSSGRSSGPSPGPALAELETRIAAHTGQRDFEAEVAAMPALPRHVGSRVLAGLDALFVGASTPRVPQQLGAVVMLGAPRDLPMPAADRIAATLRERLTERAAALPLLHRQLWLRPGRRPRWRGVHRLDPAAHVTWRSVEDSWSAAVQEFFDTPVPLDRPPWRLQVLHEPGHPDEHAGTGQTAVLAALHHSLGDGLAVTAAITGLLSDVPMPSLRPVGRAEGPSGSPTRRAARLAVGLLELATAGRAAAGSPPPSSPRRNYAVSTLPAARMRAVARRRGVSTTALLLGVLGEALYRRGDLRDGLVSATGRLRTAVPVAGQRVRLSESTGNYTAALMLDLPVGPMGLGGRVDVVADALARRGAGGQPAASRFALGMLGRLPAGLQARLARQIYGGRFFSLIASVLPGLRREVRVLGAPVTSVLPVMPLAEGVGLAVGFVSWGSSVGVGVSTDSVQYPDAEGLAAAVVDAFLSVASESATDAGEAAGHVR